MNSLDKYAKGIDSLIVFNELKKDTVFSCLEQFLKEPSLKNYSTFVYSLYEKHTQNLSAYIKEQAMSLENACMYFACLNQPIPDLMAKTAAGELEFLESLNELQDVKIDGIDMTQNLQFEPMDLKKEYFYRLEHLEQYGYGIFSKYHMFRMEKGISPQHSYQLKPVEYPDPTLLKDLIGYERQHNEVMENTQVLIKGALASNVLLYGDAGTGKSATVKAIANELKQEGLRLIEIPKNMLHALPKLLDDLSKNPLKFILFIDDLSFQDNDDDFSALKAVLEGSVATRSTNTVIYATSNRRHLVKETFQSREGDEIHRQDTMQETISLSERFGLKVYYEKPRKDVYLQIVSGLAQQYGIEMDEKTLYLKAEQFALRKAGRSARAARQLVEQLYAKQKGRNLDLNANTR